MLNDFSEGVLKDLRLKKSLVYSAGISIGYYPENSTATFSTECDKENVNEIIKTLANYLKNISKNGFSKQQFDKAKRIFEYNRAVSEITMNRISSKLYDFKMYNKILKSKDHRERIKKATIKECNQIFKEVFENPTVSLLVYGTAKKDEIITKNQFQEIFKW